MKENEIFNIQHHQLNEELAKIQWIADNPQKLIRALRAKVAEANTTYLTDDDSSPDAIFRGCNITQWVHTYVTCEIDWEKDDR